MYPAGAQFRGPAVNFRRGGEFRQARLQQGGDGNGAALLLQHEGNGVLLH
jgi:hypothetical protein